MLNFVKTAHCKLRVHCETCRDLKGGHNWRESLRKSLTLPNDETDFECPHGVPWNPTEEELPKLKAENSKLKTDICPYLKKTCCGEPNLCGRTGAEVDRGICQKCEIK